LSIQQNRYNFNEQAKLLLQIKSVETHCGVSFITTEEGIYLLNTNQISDRTQAQLQKQLSKVDQKALTDLQLADLDFASYSLIKQEINTKNKICYLFMSIMNIIKHIPNRFTRLLDSTGQVVIVYNRNGDLIVPNCLNLNEVEVLEDTSKCYNDFPVRLTLNNKSVIGFLTEDNIIQEYSKIVECDTANKSLYFPTLNMRIKKIGSRTFKKYEVNRKTKLNYKQKNFAKLNFHHSSLVVNGVDTISEFLKLTQITEKDEVLVVEHDKSNDSSDYSTKTEHKRSNFLNNLLKSILIITSIGISISCLILLLIFQTNYDVFKYMQK